MRVLLAAYAARSHLLPMVPLAQALAAAGHEVRVASQPALAGDIAAGGLTAVPVGRDHIVRRVLGARPDIAARLRNAGMPPFDLAQGPPEGITWEALSAGYRDFAVPWLFRLVNEPMLADLVEFCRFWRPDLVIWEPITLAAPLAAAAVGAAQVRLLWSADLFGHLRASFTELRGTRPVEDRADPLAELMERWGARYGVTFTEELLSGRLTVDQTPPSIRMEPGLPCLSMRYVPYHGPSVLPRWLWRRPERPRVCVTLGITDGQLHGRSSLPLDELLSALAGLDADVVTTLPAHDHRKMPANVTAVGWVPLRDLVSGSSAVIHHAGWGTVCTTAYCGVPQLALAQREFDGPLLARSVAAQEAGLVLEPENLDGDRVRDCVRRLLEDPPFRRGAARLREEMRSMPSPAEVVAELEGL